MQERLNKILKYYKLTPAQLADSINVQRSSISHILSGRNKPSYDFLVKILSKFNHINANWLLSGHGNMLLEPTENLNEGYHSTEPELFTKTTQNVDKQQYKPSKEPKNKQPEFTPDDTLDKDIISAQTQFTNVNKVKSIVFVYSDNTFEVINKR